MTFPDVLVLYHERRYTGAMTLHWAQGRVVMYEMPREPERIRLDTGRDSVKLDDVGTLASAR